MPSPRIRCANTRSSAPRPCFDDVRRLVGADVRDAVAEVVEEQPRREAAERELAGHVEQVLRLAGQRPLERRLDAELLGQQRDLRVDERVVRVEEEVLAELPARLELDAEVPGVVRVLERGDRVGGGDDDPLDRLVEVLVEDAGRQDAAAAA